MLKLFFNCGVGFANSRKKKYKKNELKIFFSKSSNLTEIGYISKQNKKINFYNSLQW